MNDIFGKVISILLCAWLMFIYPLNAAKEENSQMERMYIYQETVRFVDNICNTGVISDKDMRNYLNKISSMNTLYDVSITHDSRISDDEKEELETEGFYVSYYESQIFDALNEHQEYKLGYSDFIKIIIYNDKGNMTACYGGSVKAEEK